MKYKEGDKVILYSWEELQKKYDNGFTVKSYKWENINGSFFGMDYETYHNITKNKVQIISLDKDDFKIIDNNNFKYDIPYEWIKDNSVNLPDELFTF